MRKKLMTEAEIRRVLLRVEVQFAMQCAVFAVTLLVIYWFTCWLLCAAGVA